LTQEYLRKTCSENTGKIDTWGLFHQTFSPSKKMPARARRLAKNSPFNFTNSQLQNCEAKFRAKNSPNLCAIRQMLFFKKGVEFCAQKYW
jgi:hypothetical protein